MVISRRMFRRTGTVGMHVTIEDARFDEGKSGMDFEYRYVTVRFDDKGQESMIGNVGYSGRKG